MQHIAMATWASRHWKHVLCTQSYDSLHAPIEGAFDYKNIIIASRTPRFVSWRGIVDGGAARQLILHWRIADKCARPHGPTSRTTGRSAGVSVKLSRKLSLASGHHLVTLYPRQCFHCQLRHHQVHLRMLAWSLSAAATTAAAS